MRLRWIRSTFLLMIVPALAAWAQTTPPAPAKPATQAPATQAPAQQTPQSLQERIQGAKPGTNVQVTPEDLLAPHPEQVAADAPVITLQGSCNVPEGFGARKTGDCAAALSKQDFETLMNALDPNMPPASRGSLADQYTKILIMAGEALKQGVDGKPRTQEVLKFMRMQVLANLFNQQLQETARTVPAETVQKYFEAHLPEFEEVTVRRLFIPKNVPPDAKKLSDAELAALSGRLAARAKAGEDLNKLQKEAFDTLGIKNPPPPTDMGAQRRANLPPAQASSVFALKPGEVSGVITDTMGAFVYKVEAKRTLPLEQVKPDIERTLQAQQYQAALAAIFEPVKATLNPEYFGRMASITFPQRPAEKPKTPAPPAPAKPGGAPQQH